jgi:hypothetical protein
MTKGGIMNISNLIIISILAIISFNSFAYDYENFGKLPSEVYDKQASDDIEALVTESKALRKDLENFRNIASFTAEDEYWANEYENLMKDTTKKDYLDMASKL